jgi:hypothetical protein
MCNFIIMNSFLHKNEFLATGNQAPFNGPWVNTALCKNGFIVVFVSGVADINLQAKTELYGHSIFGDGGIAEAITFYTETGISNGYSNPIFFDSPISQIRISAQGSGSVWSYISFQN